MSGRGRGREAGYQCSISGSLNDSCNAFEDSRGQVVFLMSFGPCCRERAHVRTSFEKMNENLRVALRKWHFS